MINVTRTYLPSFEDYCERIRPLWESGWITNRGVLALELEQKVKNTLGVSNLLYVNNGMQALQIAIKALGLKGEIITTPFSYVATTGAIVWEGCTPVFSDIEPLTFCIDPSQIEALITPQTSAILATHVFGFPCDVTAIQRIADKYGLKVIYDGAHAFGASYEGKSLLSFGDISICSFHATKLFHTVEGGAIICKDPDMHEKVRLLHQFGHSYDDYLEIGTNAKVSEFHAAMGLCVLEQVPSILTRRRELFAAYKLALEGLPVGYPDPHSLEGYNYAYFPILLKNEKQVLELLSALKEHSVNCRRYFYPSLNTLPYVQYQACPVSEDVASRILCLPFYPNLSNKELELITDRISHYFLS